MASLVQTALLAAAPLSVRQAPGRATSQGITGFSGRRGCGTPKTLLQVSGRGHAYNLPRRRQRPSDFSGEQRAANIVRSFSICI
jgi:hypothetical protein